MKQIENLLAEYKIRFRDTDRIKEEGYPFQGKEMLNDGKFVAQITQQDMLNRNGAVYEDGIWATADIKFKPDNWIIERDDNHPMWGKFKIWYESKSDTYLDFGLNYYGINSERDQIMDNCLLNFKNEQYLTLDQWHEIIYLPEQKKVDLSILNDEDWFYIENMYGYLIRGNISLNGYELSFDNVYCIKTNTLRFNESMISDNVTVLRKATPEDLKPLYKKHPELEPPKIGDLCVFWDENEDLIEQEILINYLKKIYTHHNYIYISNNINWKYAMKILPTWGYSNILERYETFKKVML